jgi:hypothetical protein
VTLQAILYRVVRRNWMVMKVASHRHIPPNREHIRPDRPPPVTLLGSKCTEAQRSEVVASRQLHLDATSNQGRRIFLGGGMSHTRMRVLSQVTLTRRQVTESRADENGWA